MLNVSNFRFFVISRRSDGNPDPAEAFRKARISILEAGDRVDVPNYVILITHSMRQESDVIHEANKLKQKGTKVFGVGKTYDNQLLRFLFYILLI